MSTPNIRHMRNRKFSRLRHGKKLSSWLALQASRLSTTAAVVFRLLAVGFTAKQVETLQTDPDLANTVAPVISGTVAVGNTLTKTSDGTWSGLAPISYSYQWQRDGEDIASATGETYVIPEGGAGPYTCDVTAHSPVASLTVSSNALS